ncbi:RpiB/LacA/LacB family sugar-phosphate isomerase [Vagococcus sp. JNUCC 83]
MKIIMGADPSRLLLKNEVKQYLSNKGVEVTDITENSEQAYYSVGFEVGKAIANKEYDRGFIFCGTGMGVNIVANKFTGVYSALCESIETATLARKINNANVLAMGRLIITPYLAKKKWPILS